ncbi:hemerythrin domain-containing protein [Noviherbaspirillum galbum]|uniref:Hemerythrin-like domain-containing protein n=1 Tax=Noviherbaspirillum galbum TaxID=2709383 RepID=A0A6B3SG77_9BURK|nr:hemerythrin domain-containing protein [Noviherbaspirillum galbum]NEX59620.1 hypothetical protein [Noviherbaspirillum galbum]
MHAIESTATSGQASQHQRVDIYRRIHKALRLCMTTTLTRLGAADPADDAAMTECVAQVRELLHMFQGHLEKENTYVHPAMEARVPASSARIADEHVHHEAEIHQLHQLAMDVELAPASSRAAEAHALYRVLAAFVGDNLVHMQFEETAHNAALQDAYTDGELIAIEQSIVNSLSPAEKAHHMRWMLPALNAAERLELLIGVRDNAPPPVLEGMLSIARAHLTGGEYDVLLEGLGQPARLAA